MNAARPRRSWLSGLIGHGVGPSLTPEMHEREAERQGIRYVYKLIDQPDGSVDRDHLAHLLAAATELGFDGLNITHPVKQAMVPLVDETAPAVQAIGALNTIIIRDGRTTGHNTDVTGFKRSFDDGLPDVDRDRVVLLGAGGAGTAVAYAALRLGVRELAIADVDDERARASGLIHATPTGMAQHPGLPLDAELLRPDLWIAEVVYRPLETELLGVARELGCRTLDGGGMAVFQAADAFALFTDIEPDRERMLRHFSQLVDEPVSAR